MSSEQKPYPPPVEQSFVSHLVELRDRLLRSVVVVIAVFLSLFYFANDLYAFLAEPLLRHMPEGTNMIATEVASPFLTPFKLTLVVSVFIAIPYLLYQAWSFIAPGLYQNEKRLVYPLLVSSIILFYLGMAFAYYVVFPLVFGFLTSVTPAGVEMMTDIARYLDFVLKMFFAFGIAFEVPIATILVIWSGMTTAESLASKRPYIIVAAFVIGMLLTPPDVISQTLLAIPMWALFELGLIMSKMYTRPEEEVAMESAGGQAIASEEILDINEGDIPKEDAGYGDQYQDDTGPMTEEEMDAELDRIEAEEAEQEADDSKEPHGEYEPLPDELGDQPTDVNTGAEAGAPADQGPKNGGSDKPEK